MRNTLQSATLAILATFLLYSQALGQAPVLTYGNNNTIDLVENQANQRVDFFVSNIAGMGFDTFDLFIQIGDAGRCSGEATQVQFYQTLNLATPEHSLKVESGLQRILRPKPLCSGQTVSTMLK